MADFKNLKIIGYDYVEFAVKDLEQSSLLMESFGFSRIQESEQPERKLKSHLFLQSQIAVVLSHSSDPNDWIYQYVQNHGDGICDVGLLCEDSALTLEMVSDRGAKVVDSPVTCTRDFGNVTQASIQAFGDVRHSFVSRKGQLFLRGFENPVKRGLPGVGLLTIDHITFNVEKGQLEFWEDWYARIFGFETTRYFDIRTDRTGLNSKVLQSPNGIIKMPCNIPTENTSQIQEFLDIHHGPGIQHLALNTNSILNTLPLLKNNGRTFLDIPHTYYEVLKTRLPNVEEDVGTLEALQILADGDEKGYLLQIFSTPVIGPFFFEVIQRKGNDGFGEGNFSALFEAMERDQIARGVLPAN